VLELRSKKTGMQQKCTSEGSGHAPSLLIRNYSWGSDPGFKQGPMFLARHHSLQHLPLALIPVCTMRTPLLKVNKAPIFPHLEWSK
jgi:hypothetical protein